MAARPSAPALAALAVALLTAAAQARSSGAPVSSASAAAEWASLRGPSFDGSASAGSSFCGWRGAGLAVAWRTALGPGYSGVAVARGRAVTAFSDGEDDVVAAFDAMSGRELWRQSLGPTYRGHDGSFDGPIATPAVAGGRVFALGPRGHLVALDAMSGSPLWKTHLVEDQGGTRPHWGFAASPIVAAGVLVVPLGAGAGRAIAGFDPSTGARRWVLGDDVVNYQAPIVAQLGGREPVVAVGDNRLFGIDPAAGRLLWEHAHGGDAQAIGSQSLVPVPAGGGRLFLKSRTDLSTMLRILPRPDGSLAVETLWTAPVLRNTYSLPVYHDGHLYGMNGVTVLTCVDASTGEMRWRSREPGDGFPLLVGDELVVLTKEGALHVGPASPEGWQERTRLQLFRDVVWTPPSFAAGAVFARSQGEIARIEWRQAAPPGRPTRWLAASSDFGRFLAQVESARDKTAVVDRFLASVPGFPLLEWPDRVVFLYRGDAHDMGVTGDLIGERREEPMTRVPGTDLFWYATRLEPDARVSYEFVRDFEEHIPDPLNPRRVPVIRGTASGAVEGQMSSLAMPAWREPAHLREPPLAAPGRIETHQVTSATWPGRRVTLHVYLPAGYDTGSERLPAVYVSGGDEARSLGHVHLSLDSLVGRTVQPLIAVFVGGLDWGDTRPKEGEREQAAAEGRAVAEMLAKEVVPFVDKRFRTRPEPVGRAIVGAAFYGWIAAYAAFRHPEIFGALGTQSLHMLDGEEAVLKREIATAEEEPLRLYLDWGRYDLRATREAWDLAETNRRFAAFLRERGYRPAGGEAPDGFGWPSWRNRTDRLFEALFPASTDRGTRARPLP